LFTAINGVTKLVYLWNSYYHVNENPV